MRNRNQFNPKVYLVTTASVVLLNLIFCLLILILQSKLPPLVPLLYGQPEGQEQLAQSIFLVVPFLIASLIAGINTILVLRSKDWFIQNVALGINIVVTLLVTITTFKIIFLVAKIF